jgi:hypothetical protein
MGIIKLPGFEKGYTESTITTRWLKDTKKGKVSTWEGTIARM